VWGEPGMAALWGAATRKSSVPGSVTRARSGTWLPGRLDPPLVVSLDEAATRAIRGEQFVRLTGPG
jgi:hypothetical protein